jgi:hypothetical protein
MNTFPRLNKRFDLVAGSPPVATRSGPLTAVGRAFDGGYWYLGKTALVYDETRIGLGMELLSRWGSDGNGYQA